MDDREKRGPGDGGTSQGPRAASARHEMPGNDAGPRAAQTPSFDDAEAMAAAGYELIPLHRWNETRAGKNGKVQQLGKAPRDKAWTTRKYENADVIAEARATGINLGVRLRATDLVVDVDPRNGGNESLAKLKRHLGLSLGAYPVVVTGSGGRHYYMRKPAGLATVGKLDGYDGIDFKTLGGQVVAPGSVHPCRRRYECEFSLAGPGDTPEAPAELLGLLAVRSLPRPDGVEDADRWDSLTPELLAETLEKIPPEDFGEGEHDRWFLLMCACHHATAGAGRAEFVDWSTRAPGYEDHAELVGYRWDSLSKRGSGRPVTINYLYKVLRDDYGDEVARTGPEQDFDAWDEPKRPEAPPPPELVAAVDGWVWVADAQVFIRRSDLKRYRPDQWKSMYAHLWEGDILNKVWKSRDFVAKFESLTYLPGAGEMPDGPRGKYNLWRPSALTPEPGDVSWFLEHMAYLVPDERERGLLLDYLAHLVQRPDQKIHFALLMRGEEGTGKSAIGEILTRIIGDANVVIPKNDELLEKWTGWQERAQVAIISELMTQGRLEVANRLKPVITDPKLRIEEKYQVPYSIDNHLNLVCFTNHRDAIKLSAGDRRWFVVFSPAMPRDDAYYISLFDDHILADGPARVAHWLMRRDLSGFNAKGRAPHTSAKEEMLGLTQGSVESHLGELLRDGIAPFDFDLVTAEEVEACVPDDVRREARGNFRPTVRKFLLDVARAVQHPRNKNAVGGAAAGLNYRLWSLRDHARWADDGPTGRAKAHADHRARTTEGFVD